MHYLTDVKSGWLVGLVSHRITPDIGLRIGNVMDKNLDSTIEIASWSLRRFVSCDNKRFREHLEFPTIQNSSSWSMMLLL